MSAALWTLGCGEGDAADSLGPDSRRSRPPAVAGSFYEGQPEALARHVRALLDAAPRPAAGRLRAAVVPHAGYCFSGPCAASLFAGLASGDVDRVLILAPSHTRAFRGCAIPPAALARFATPLGEVPIDRETCDRLAAGHPFQRAPDGADRREHAIEVQLPFLQVALGSFRLIPVLCGTLSPEDQDAAAEALAPLLDGRTLVLASSDFTHFGEAFGFQPFGERVRDQLYELLHRATQAIVRQDLEAFTRHCDQTGDTICGRVPIALMLAMLRRHPERLEGRIVDLATSGDRTGDYRHCVSYGAIGFYSNRKQTGGDRMNRRRTIVERRSGSWSAELTDGERATLFAIVQAALDQAAHGRRTPFDEGGLDLTPRLKAEAATFVTLTLGGRLRGCIGSLAPVEPLYRSVCHHAIQAALHDPRFPPLTPAERERVRVAISILSPIRDATSWQEFAIGRHGIILTKQGRRAVYLPEVALEQGWTVEETLSSLSEKAGLPADAWREGATFQVFESVVLTEE